MGSDLSAGYGGLLTYWLNSGEKYASSFGYYPKKIRELGDELSNVMAETKITDQISCKEAELKLLKYLRIPAEVLYVGLPIRYVYRI